MQGVPRTLPDCSNQASLAEVSQFRTKKEYCSQSRPTGTSLSTLAGNFGHSEERLPRLSRRNLAPERKRGIMIGQ